jgi:hypothetical protein
MPDTKGYKHTHRGCVTLIAFLLQQWLHERASMLQYTCIAFLVLLHVLFWLLVSSNRFSYFQSHTLRIEVDLITLRSVPVR